MYAEQKTLSRLKTADKLSKKILEIISEEELIIAAKSNICPHYKIKNPVTNNVEYRFDPSEVSKWFESACMRWNPGNKNLEINFNVFNEAGFKDILPKELVNIHEVYQLDLSKIYSNSGVYFLYLDRKLQYIGQSVQVFSRIATHINEKVKDFNKAYFIPCSHIHLNDLEGALVRKFKPPLTMHSPIPVDENILDQYIKGN